MTADQMVFTDTHLIQRWLYAHNQKPRKGGMALWAKVCEEFCVGSTVAQEICRRNGYDPDALVKRA